MSPRPNTNKPKSKSSSDKDGIRIVAQNRSAFYNYILLDKVEAGIVLVGTEVKTLREGKATLREAYAEPRAGELWLMNAHIPEYRAGGVWNHNPMRPRKLLLHRRELDKLAGRAQQRGLTLVPLKIYFRGNRAKCELALGQGKKFHDKRQSERDQEARREAKEAMARSRKR